MKNDREAELLHRRDAILRETANLTSDVVQSLEQQQQFAANTKENLDHQNAILSQANRKMRSMNDDLTAVVDEMNEIEAQQGCLCCRVRRPKKKALHVTRSNGPILPSQPSTMPEKPNPTVIPALIENNEQEKQIVQELNQMKRQFLQFQDQIQTINRTFEEGDQIIHQMNNETDQYMSASTLVCLSINHRCSSIAYV